MPVIHDEEFGKITIRRSTTSKQVSLRVAPDGTLRASLPVYAPIFLVKRLLKTSRDELRALLDKSSPKYEYSNGMQIGKSHTLIIKNITAGAFKVNRHGQQIIISLPKGTNINESSISRKIRDVIISSFRIEAKSYLPKRLSFLAAKHSINYTKVRFSHASGRWGSCSSNGTISLNIALMKLSFELIDYVIIHELSHIKEMNHGPSFWKLVEEGDPNYKMNRKLLKLENPSI